MKKEKRRKMDTETKGKKMSDRSLKRTAPCGLFLFFFFLSFSFSFFFSGPIHLHASSRPKRVDQGHVGSPAPRNPVGVIARALAARLWVVDMRNIAALFVAWIGIGDVIKSERITGSA